MSLLVFSGCLPVITGEAGAFRHDAASVLSTGTEHLWAALLVWVTGFTALIMIYKYESWVEFEGSIQCKKDDYSAARQPENKTPISSIKMCYYEICLHMLSLSSLHLDLFGLNSDFFKCYNLEILLTVKAHFLIVGIQTRIWQKPVL